MKKEYAKDKKEALLQRENLLIMIVKCIMKG